MHMMQSTANALMNCPPAKKYASSFRPSTAFCAFLVIANAVCAFLVTEPTSVASMRKPVEVGMVRSSAFSPQWLPVVLLAAQVDGRRLGLTGEQACEGHAYNEHECRQVGCCQWAECPRWRSRADVVGQCHSARTVQRGQCTSVPFESHIEYGKWCQANLKDVNVDGPRTRWFDWLIKPGFEPCEGDCDSDHDCANYLGTEVGGFRRSGKGTCFHRSGLEPVPGCMGTGRANWDYCILEEW